MEACLQMFVGAIIGAVITHLSYQQGRRHERAYQRILSERLQ